MRTDFTAIADHLEFIMGRLAQVPIRRELAGVAAGFFIAGAALATLVNVLFVH